MKILMIGSAGRIGRTLVRGLGTRHELRCLDVVPTPGRDDAMVADADDYDTVLEATRGMEAVIHLVHVGGGDQWQDAQKAMRSAYNMYEACRLNEVKRVAFASRAGVLPRSFYPRNIQRTAEMLPKPDSLYTITKVFGESLGYMYTSRHGLEVVGVRIGNFNPDRDQPEDPHHLSHGDCVRLFEAAVTHPGVEFEVVFGVSDSDWPLYDLDHGRRVIGYHPQDRSIVPEDQRD